MYGKSQRISCTSALPPRMCYVSGVCPDLSLSHCRTLVISRRYLRLSDEYRPELLQQANAIQTRKHGAGTVLFRRIFFNTMYGGRRILHTYQTGSARAAGLERYASPITVSVLQALAPPETKLNRTSHTHHQTRSTLAAGPNIPASDMPDEGLAKRRQKSLRGLLLYKVPLGSPHHDRLPRLINTQCSGSSSIPPLLT